MSDQYITEEILDNGNSTIIAENDGEDMLEDDILQRPDVRGFFNNGQRLEFELSNDKISIDLFRFSHVQLKYIARTMCFPERIYFRTNDISHRFSFGRVLCLGIMLRRLAYPNRLPDLEMLFGINQTTIDVVFNGMIEIVHDNFHEGIRFNKKHLNPFNLQMFSAVIQAKGKHDAKYII